MAVAVLAACFCLGAQTAPLRSADSDHYRRSSLCLILLAHSDKQYADAMTRVFQSFPMPARYNEHNISDVRVVRVYGKQSREDIERILRENKVSSSIVSRWFNRDPWSGNMDLDLIHDRGGFGAFHDDYVRAQNTTRGTTLLREEGIELLESTFVLVCDMDYYDRSKGFKWGAFGAAVLSIGASTVAAVNEVQAQEAYSNGDYQSARRHSNNAAAWNLGATGAAVGAAVLSDLGGFSVKIHAYLYRLRWDEYATENIFTNYWVDGNTPRAEAERRRQSFENARFGLEYIGDYKAKSGKTILKSWSNEDEVILDVCQRTVEKGITSLAKKFEVFRPRTPFYFNNGLIYSHIGTKEDVSEGTKYEIVRRERDGRGRVKYKRMGVVEALSVWNNQYISFDNYFDPATPGTLFVLKKGNQQDLAMTPGLQIREMK